MCTVYVQRFFLGGGEYEVSVNYSLITASVQVAQIISVRHLIFPWTATGKAMMSGQNVVHVRDE
jgi:hypothetical protein